MNCPECNAKLRKFKMGVICNKNHKFLCGTKIYDIFYDTKTYVDPKLLCYKCGEKGNLYSFDHSAIKCSNDHMWGI